MELRCFWPETVTHLTALTFSAPDAELNDGSVAYSVLSQNMRLCIVSRPTLKKWNAQHAGSSGTLTWACSESMDAPPPPGLDMSVSPGVNFLTRYLLCDQVWMAVWVARLHICCFKELEKCWCKIHEGLVFWLCDMKVPVFRILSFLVCIYGKSCPCRVVHNSCCFLSAVELG